MDIPGLIDTYGYIAVFVGAFLEGETILALAGLAAYRGYLDFKLVVLTALFAGFIGAAIWAPLIAGIGYEFGEIVEAVLGDIKRVELWVFGAVVVIGLAVFVIHHIKVKREEQA